MKLAALAAGFLLVASCALFARADKPEAAPLLSLPTENGPCRVRLEVLVNGQPPAVAWERFLDRLFDFFDQDRDGSLSRVELGRMMPLPLPERRQLSFDPASIDRDGSGVSHSEFKTACRERGFTPVVIALAPPTDEDWRLGAVFRQWLDKNGDGRFASSELRQAAPSMGRYDLNEDDLLDRNELLSSADASPDAKDALPKANQAAGEEHALLRVNLDAAAQAVAVEERESPSWTAVAGAASRQSECFRGPGNRWMLVVETLRTLPNVASASDFLIAQFQTTLGSRSDLPRNEIAQDASLSGLAELAPLADRNGDERVSLAELQAYADLVAAAVQSQVWATVTDRRDNLFPFLDGDGDGRLSFLELRKASNMVPENAAPGSLPRQIQVSFGTAPVRSWGGMMIPSPAKKRAAGAQAVATGPPWFQAIDRNRDGVASPREFLGPPDAFRRLDSDRDGTISLAEASAATDH